MKILPYKILLFLAFTAFALNAQDKKYKEEFTVKSDVVIDINTRHSDIEIQAWNKNKVVVEAFMIIEGEEFSEEEYNEFFKKWDFEVTGNSKEVTIKSRTNSTINIHSFNFDDIDYDAFTFPLVDVSIGSLDILDSIDFIMPPLPPEAPMFPEMPVPSYYFIPDLPSEFNFEAYKNDKSYLERWKKENQDALGENVVVKIGKNSVYIKSDEANITMKKGKSKVEYFGDIAEERKEDREERKEILVARRKYLNEIKLDKQQKLEERQESLNERRKQLLEQREELKKRKEEIKKNIKEQVKNQKEKRLEIQKMLKERSKLKVKRIIRIKAPKKAKLNMNVKYGELSFTN